MAELSEKQAGSAAIEIVDTLDKPTIVDTRLVFGDEAFNQAMLKEPPIP
jgi:hypothetical protein